MEFPWKTSKRVYQKAKDFKPVTLDQITDEFRSIDKEDELQDYYKPKQQASPFQITLIVCLNNQGMGSSHKSIKGENHYVG